MAKKPFYIFLHVPKTAGTTFNFHALKNLSPEEGIDLDRIDPSLNKNLYRQVIFNRQNIKKYADKAISKIPKYKRKKTKLIYDSHFAYYGIHKHFNNVDPKYFTFIRNPVTRNISTYNYLTTLYNLETKKGKTKKLYQTLLLVNKKYPTFEEWFEKKFNKHNWTMLTMPTHRILQAINMLETGKITNKSINEMFKKLYFVGTTKSFSQDILYLYYKLGFKKFFHSQNSSTKYFKPDNTDDIKKMMIKKNKASFEIFEKAQEENEKFKQNNPEYFEIVNMMKLKRNLTLPITQIVYDPRGSVGYLSSNLRRKVPYYGEALNYFKHNILN